MGELLRKPYEISVWEDELVTQNGKSFYQENKLATIGSDTMVGKNKIYDPVFTKNFNGEKTLTFSLVYKYFEPYSGIDGFVNPFAALLINERKVKLKYDNEWYDFIIKEHTESSDGLVWTYTCTDAFVQELSKTGYNLEFSADLNNNQGTALELSKKVVEGTDWDVTAETFTQLVEEPIYKAVLKNITGITIENANGDSTPIPVANTDIYVFYSYVANKNGKFVQFMLRDPQREVIKNDKNVITDTNFRIKTDLIYDEAARAFKKDNTIVIQINTNSQTGALDVDNEYHAYRLAYNQLTTHDPVLDRVVQRYSVEGRNTEVYSYTDYNYTTSNIVSNFITNGDNFSIIKNSEGTVPQGWSGYTPYTGNKITPIKLASRPELSSSQPLAALNNFGEIETFLAIDFNGPFDSQYRNTVFNSGISDNASSIGSIRAGDEFLFRWRGGSATEHGDINDNAVQSIKMIVAKYNSVQPSGKNYYLREIDKNNIILQFSGTPKIADSYIDGGTLVNNQYVIDGVSQEPSSKYIYRVKNGSTTNEYKWDSKNRTFTSITESNPFRHYYYLTASAKRTITEEELSNPNTNIGIFIYTTYSESTQAGVYFFLQDVQLTRYYKYTENGVTKPVLLGNVPEAQAEEKTYYYEKPKLNTEAAAVPRFTTLDALASKMAISKDKIKPKYNENSEKTLSISESQSNCFNILQTIAETFECWIKIDIKHDDQGKIVYSYRKTTDTEVDSNKVYYVRSGQGTSESPYIYNWVQNPVVSELVNYYEYKSQKYIRLLNFIGKDNYAGFKYGINVSSIERTINSDEIVTKLIVNQAQSDYVEDGIVSIQKAKTNPSGESYILNFDYYLNQGLMGDAEHVKKCRADLNQFNSKLKEYNNQLSTLETQRIKLENALAVINSQRNVFAETINVAKDTVNEKLLEFQSLTGIPYAQYQANHTTIADIDKKLTQEQTVLGIIGELYSNSAIINNYSGFLTNLENEYWNIRRTLKGIETYYITVQVEKDALDARHVIVNVSDYMVGTKFTIGDDVVCNVTTSNNVFDVITNATTITFNAVPKGYQINTSGAQTIDDSAIMSYTVSPISNVDNVEDKIKRIQTAKDKLTQSFNNKYNRFIQEGTWNSTDYIDSELYYLDALQVSTTSSQPKVEYNINVVEISEIEGYEWYLFDVGDKTYIEDTEFFGWHADNIGTVAEPHLVYRPAREEILVSIVEWHLDDPSNNVITVQNYKTRFEDLFQRISAAVQTVQYNEATYAKISSLLDADGTINQNVLLAAMNNIAGKEHALTSDGSILIAGDQILIQNLQNQANRVILDSGGIKISTDGGKTSQVALDADGIRANIVYGGVINTDKVIIGNQRNPSFRWDKSGISAYRTKNPDDEESLYDLQTFVRYDQYGLYGIKDNGAFLATSVQDVKDKAHFAVTWDGFFIKNSYEGGGQVEITSDNDFRVLNDPTNQGDFQEKIKIGALEWGKDGQNNPIISPDAEGATALPTLYGIRIKNDDGTDVFKTGDDGNITITGTINANAGNIGGMTVNSDWLRMNYIVLEPGEGIYSTYPNVKGEPPVDPSITAYPFWISDTDGSAIFNNVTVRGSIKTSVFEYEEIQAVGGAFMFRPSSAVRDVEIDGNDLIFTTEKPGLFKVGSWLKISNFSSADEQDEVTPDELNGFGLTYIYKVGAINGRQVRLIGAKEILNNNVTTREELAGGSLIDMGNEAGTSNYGIGINSSDGFINLPPRAISLFETVIHPNQDPKVSYRYKGILGTLPDERVNNLNVNTGIYQNMRGTQGIYTNNMYIGDNKNFITYYYDKTANEYRLIINADTIYEGYDDEGEPIPVGGDGKDGEDAITVIIDSSTGNMFVRQDVRATLTCHVYQGSGMDPEHEITDQVTKFTWVKYDKNGIKDETWARLPGGQSITIGPEDVASKAIFKCEVEF